MNRGKRQRYTIILYSDRGKKRCSFGLIRNPHFINQATKGDKSNRWEIIHTIRTRFNIKGYIHWRFIEIVNEKGQVIKSASVPKPVIQKPQVKVTYTKSEKDCDCGCSRCQDGMYCPSCNYHGQKSFERNWA